MEIICSTIKDELKNGTVGEGSVRSCESGKEDCVVIHGLKSNRVVEHVRV